MFGRKRGAASAYSRPDAAAHDIKVLATDIDPHILEVGKKGVYAESLLTDVPPDLRKRFFEPHRGDGQQQWRVNEALRSLVAFRPLNLMQDWPMRGAFHAIFCRNVVIYFDEPTQQRLWSKFVPRLEPGGWPYIGHSERVSGPAGAQLGGLPVLGGNAAALYGFDLDVLEPLAAVNGPLVDEVAEGLDLVPAGAVSLAFKDLPPTNV